MNRDKHNLELNSRSHFSYKNHMYQLSIKLNMYSRLIVYKGIFSYYFNYDLRVFKLQNLII